MTIGNLADELNDVLRTIEIELTNLETHGQTGEIEYSRGMFRLSFGKMDGEWRLIALFPASGEQTPLLNASLEMRCLAVEHLDALHMALSTAANAQKARVEMAIKEARDFFARIRGELT